MTWQTLRVLDSLMLSEVVQRVTIELPEDAQTVATAFRWWQPVLTPGKTVTIELTEDAQTVATAFRWWQPVLKHGTRV